MALAQEKALAELRDTPQQQASWVASIGYIYVPCMMCCPLSDYLTRHIVGSRTLEQCKMYSVCCPTYIFHMSCCITRAQATPQHQAIPKAMEKPDDDVLVSPAFVEKVVEQETEKVDKSWVVRHTPVRRSVSPASSLPSRMSTTSSAVPWLGGI